MCPALLRGRDTFPLKGRTGNLSRCCGEWMKSVRKSELSEKIWVTRPHLFELDLSISELHTEVPVSLNLGHWDVHLAAGARPFVAPPYLFCLSLQIIMLKVVQVAEGNVSLYFKYCHSSCISAQTHFHEWFGLRCQWVNRSISITGTFFQPTCEGTYPWQKGRMGS